MCRSKPKLHFEVTVFSVAAVVSEIWDHIGQKNVLYPYVLFIVTAAMFFVAQSCHTQTLI